MAERIIDIHDLPARLDEMISLARSGIEVILTEGTKPRARLVPLRTDHPRVAELHPGAIQTTDDFDAPLSDDFWLGKS